MNTRKILAMILAMVLYQSVSNVAVATDGRWKSGGGGECYWDPEDSGPDQCDPSPGRFKSDGGGGCYWDVNDSGADQCTPPPPSEPEFWNLAAFADDVISEIGSARDPSAGQTALQIAYSYGLTNEYPTGLDESYAAAVGQGPMGCGQRQSLEDRAYRASVAAGLVAGLLGVASAGAAVIPGGQGVAAVLVTGAAAFGAFSIAFNMMATRIGQRACT